MAIVLYTLCAVGFYVFSRSYKSFDKYYPTALYVSSSSILYQLLCRNHLLWRFSDWYFFSDKLSTLIQFAIMFPCVTITFLRCIEHRRKSAQLLIYLAFTASLVLLESMLRLSNMIVYSNGWSFGWSVFIDFCLFAVAFIHSRNVRSALVVSVCITIFLMVWFRIPLSG